VQWKDETRRYVCPCHNGVFDESGEVVGGPPLAALRRIPVMRVGDDLMVGATS
jgi:Rieske Fe-S protein